jgi:uncharacterized delta-60 repeat protein
MKLLYTSLLCLLLSEAIFSQAPGSLDLSFNTIGYNSFGTTSATFDNAQDIVTLPNGKMVFCGTTGITGNLEMCVGRMNEDGSLDITFGTNGYFIYQNSAGSDFAYDMEVLPNGNILVAGALSITAANPKFSLLCLRPDGTLESSFGDGGVFSIDIASSEDYARKILLTPTKIILAGNSKVPGFSYNCLAVASCDYNGLLDNTFGVNGFNVLNNGGNITAYSATIGSTGDLILVGDSYISNNYNPMVAKFNGVGQIMTTFGTAGVWTNMSMFGHFYDVDLNNSQLILSGNSGSGATDLLLESRTESSAILNTNFGVNGQTIINLNTSDSYYEVIFQTDGKILACGTTGSGGIGAARDFIVSRFNSNGTIDSSWGTNGHSLTNIFANWDDAYGMDLYPGNRLIVAGFSAQTNTQFAFSRYMTAELGAGCMNPLACNYNPSATVDDGSCILPGFPCNDANPNTMNDSIDVNCNCVGELIVTGCMDPIACNFNPNANIQDSSCVYPGDTCDDGDSTTINDVYTVNCGCSGEINGINEVNSIASIYPNPSSNKITIEFTGAVQGAVLLLKDIQGRVLLKKVVASNKESISVLDFASGTYFLCIESSQSIAKKIIID